MPCQEDWKLLYAKVVSDPTAPVAIICSRDIDGKAPILRRLKSAGSIAGSNLSAGQRQLISLARALLTPTNILGECCTTVALNAIAIMIAEISAWTSSRRSHRGCRHRDRSNAADYIA